MIQPQLVERPAFNDDENTTWREIMKVQRPRRVRQIVPMFMEGLKLLDMDQDKIPDLNAVNKKLKALTGWQGVYVKGLEEGESFYSMLAQKQFPIGFFVRKKTDLNYTPEPDVVHDFYGHIPFYANKKYADYCQRYGELACRYIGDKEKFRQFERLFWFTFEFGLVETSQGRRIFGAGIVSSIGECEYALSDEPEVIPYDLKTVMDQEFRIDEMQKRLFLLKSIDQLYDSLDSLL